MSANECEILHTNSSSEEAKSLAEKIHPQIATLMILKSIIESALPTLLSLFFGPWSDIAGRKVIIWLPFLGTKSY